MKLFLIIHVIFSLLLTGILYTFLGGKDLGSFIVGSSLSILNSFLLGITWRFILMKKRIALAISVIVFKYAILIVLIYSFVMSKVFDLAWLSLGIASVAGVGIPWSLIAAKKINREDSKSGSF